MSAEHQGHGGRLHTMPLVYVWRTSLPRHMLKGRKEDLQHISETKGPKNTLEFLAETQKYIEKICMPKPNLTPTSPQRSIELRSSKRRLRILIPPASVGGNRPFSRDTPRSMCLRVKSYEKMGRHMTAEGGRAVPQYAITKYMLARPVSPRFLHVHLDLDCDKMTKLIPKKVYRNQLIEEFMNRFNKK